MSTYETIMQRRTIRKFKQGVIPDLILEKLDLGDFFFLPQLLPYEVASSSKSYELSFLVFYLLLYLFPSVEP